MNRLNEELAVALGLASMEGPVAMDGNLLPASHDNTFVCLLHPSLYQTLADQMA